MVDRISVLVIEDNRTVQYIIAKLLGKSTMWKFEIDEALNMTTALTKLKENTYDVVLSDLELPDSNRQSTLKILKNSLSYLPFIILTSTDDDDLLLQSIEAGAQNYLCKDYIENGALLSRSLYNAIEHWKIMERLKYVASHDVLTGAINKGFFMEELEKSILNCLNGEPPFCVVLCDLDNFRNINNSYGHIMGDTALKTFVKTISQTIRNKDIFARFGGDEFCILFKNTDEIKCRKYLTKLSSLEIELPLEENDRGKITIKGSYGGVQYKKGMSAEQLLIKADSALYDVKENGKGFSKVI